MGKCIIPCKHEFYKNVTFLKVNQETDISTYITLKGLWGFFAINTTETCTHVPHTNTCKKIASLLRLTYYYYLL